MIFAGDQRFQTTERNAERTFDLALRSRRCHPGSASLHTEVSENTKEKTQALTKRTTHQLRTGDARDVGCTATPGGTQGRPCRATTALWIYQAITKCQIPFQDRSFQVSLNPHLSKVYDLLLDCIYSPWVRLPHRHSSCEVNQSRKLRRLCSHMMMGTKDSCFFTEISQKNNGVQNPEFFTKHLHLQPRNSHHKSELFTKLRTKRVAALQLQGMLLGGCKLPGNRMT